MIRWTATPLLASIALSACSRDDDATTPADPVATTAPGRAPAAVDGKDYFTLPLAEFMPHVMQYAADGIWKRQGYVITAKGEESLFPKDAEGWEEAESAALALAELTNVLLIPGRRVDDPRWIDPVRNVRRIALEAAAAAERQDADTWFEVGGQLDEACEACHLVYDKTTPPAVAATTPR